MGGKEMVKVNGDITSFDGKTVTELLAENGYDPKRVAVELNLDILPKSQYDSTVLKDGDSVEVVSFVGGG
ncbi:sulfur carrier protein ThiS [Ruminococcus sp.]|jgi:sulfur carrier protein